ncbi:MAG: hypothetical protein HKP48_06165 [Winogradskyella sp.]|uniref:hypothetical protein n=1 Tax=Winogradskyella sp. TaxID=1883156 RepID=UPI00181A3713|nr:hypothetical protein [Winogradskyella sp.]MBT8244753.1 hypothetical protein [Winogradskyella sp.]NNK22879.1 hypothetical protein [Winogradskyella sp.]
MTTTKPPIWFWIISVLALIWNGMGVLAYLGKAFATEEMIAAPPEEQQVEFLMEFPAWYTAAFAIAVFAGIVGALCLLIRKKMAYILFVLSALGAIIQHIYLFITVEMTGTQLVMPILVIAVCLYLIYFAKNSIKKNWIN